MVRYCWKFYTIALKNSHATKLAYSCYCLLLEWFNLLMINPVLAWLLESSDRAVVVHLVLAFIAMLAATNVVLVSTNVKVLH